MYGYMNDEGLGITIPGIGVDSSIVTGLFKRSKDPGRLSSNAKAYAQALNGDTGALNYLKGRSGRFGLVATTYGDSSPIGGWATSVAKDDAFKKYNDALHPSASYSIPKAILNGPVVAGLSVAPLLIAGVAAFGIYALTRRR
jgi:hypothetical protein